MQLYNRFLISEEVSQYLEELRVTCNMMEIDLFVSMKVYISSFEYYMEFYFEDEEGESTRYAFILRCSFTENINEECELTRIEIAEWDSPEWIQRWKTKSLEEGMEKIRKVLAEPFKYKGGKYRFNNF